MTGDDDDDHSIGSPDYRMMYPERRGTTRISDNPRKPKPPVEKEEPYGFFVERKAKRRKPKPIKDDREERENRLNELFVKEAKQRGRTDWLDDDTGLAFEAWKRDNGYD